MKKLLVSIFILWGCVVYADPIDLKFKYFTKQDGLSSIYISCVEQDTMGFIWAGTTNGLNRICENHIKAFDFIPNDSTTIPGASITDLYTTKAGDLWVGGTNGLAKYDFRKGYFRRIVYNEDTKGLKESHIKQINEDKNGDVVLATYSEISRYDSVKDTFYTIVSVKEGITCFLLNNDNSMWIGVEKYPGLFYYSEKDGLLEFSHIPQGIPLEWVTGMISKNNILYISNKGQGVFAYDMQKKQLKSFPNSDPDTNNVLFIYKDKQENIWTADYTGIKHFDESTGKFYGYYPGKSDFSIRGGSRGVFQDKQGNYWVMHYPGGLGLSVVDRGFQVLNSDEYEFFHTVNIDFSAVQEDHLGRLWSGSYNGGIDIVDWTNAKMDRLESGKDGLEKGSIISIDKGYQNQMIVSVYDQGLHFYDENYQLVKRLKKEYEDSLSISGNDIRCILKTQDSCYWFAVHGKGVDFYDGHTFKNYNSENSKLSNDWVFHMSYGPQDNLWVATAWGLSRLDKNTSQFKNYYTLNNDSNAIADNQVFVLFRDKSKILWVGTSRGLSRYNPQSDSFTNYLKGQTICGILDDNKGNIWISTSSALFQLNPHTNKLKEFNNDDGLGVSEYIVRSMYKNNYTNTLMYGGVDGLTIFNPEELVYNDLPPDVVLTDFRLFNKPVSYKKNPEIIEESILTAPKVSLLYSQNVFTIDFKAVNFINPEKNTYSYILEGFDDNWSNVKGRGSVTYTNLSPGKYKFKVMAANNDGIWNPNYRQLVIDVLPPWYLTPLFKVVAFALIIVILALIIWIRTRHLELQRFVLEEQVKEKTQELQESNIELQSQAEYLIDLNNTLEKRQAKIEAQSKLLLEQSGNLKQANSELNKLNTTKDRLISIIAHDLINPFNSLLGFIEIFKEDYYELEDEARIQMLNTIKVSSRRIYNLLSNLLTWTRAQSKSVKYDPVNFGLIEVVYETSDLLKDNRKLKNIAYNIDIDPELKVYADKDMITTVIRNLLSNAIKFTRDGGEITILAKHHKDKIQVSIADNGVGLPDTLIPKLFKEGVSSSKGTQGEKGTGLGLVICKEFVEQNKGEIWVESQAGKGTTFNFTLSKEH